MKEIRISSVSEYIKCIEGYKGDAYFRGQADSGWKIEPNIFRDNKKLGDEVSSLNITYETNTVNILSKVLHSQHHETGTRLCDLTINPLVALYFAIEDDKFDDQDACVFVLDRSNEVAIDCNEIKILLLLTTQEISTINELKTCCEHHGINAEEKKLVAIVQDNYIINHDINLSFSNSRALLQGGTGILFGFKVEGNQILRKGTINLGSIIQKIIIPNNIKQDVRNYLKSFGICKSVLYDILKGNKNIAYNAVEKTVNKFPVEKYIYDIVVSDIIFVKKDIENIVDNFFQKYLSNSNILVFAYIYYDEEDKRSYNWIAMPQLKDGILDLKYNEKYYKERMKYINKEISYTKMVSLTEPIITHCKTALENTIHFYEKYISNKINTIEYKDNLLNIYKNIHHIIFFDLQEIEHASNHYDDYYNFSASYCSAIEVLIANQISFLKRENTTKEILIWTWEQDLKLVNSSYEKYLKAYTSLPQS